MNNGSEQTSHIRTYTDDKHMKRMFDIKKIQIKMTVIEHYTPVRMDTIKIVTTLNAEKDTEKNWITNTLLVGMKNSTVTLENSWAVSYKTKYTISIGPSKWTPGNLFQRNKNLCSHENLNMNVYGSSVTCSSQN